MPRVAWWEGHVKGEDHRIPIYYTTTRKQFRMETPAIFHVPPFDTPTIYAETEEELRDTMKKLVDRLVDLQERKQKVIAYKFRASCIIYDEYDEFGDGIVPSSYVKSWSEYGYGGPGDGTTIQIDHQVLWEYTSPDRKKPYYKRESMWFGEPTENFVSWPREYKRMIWTPEAEAFFREFEDTLKKAIKRIDEFIGEDSETLLQTIQRLSGGALPFFQEEEKDEKQEVP